MYKYEEPQVKPTDPTKNPQSFHYIDPVANPITSKLDLTFDTHPRIKGDHDVEYIQQAMGKPVLVKIKRDDGNSIYKPTPELAKAAGEPYYFTGIPCKYGHISPRRVSGNKCLECRKAIQRNWTQTESGKASVAKTLAKTKANSGVKKEARRIRNILATISKHVINGGWRSGRDNEYSGYAPCELRKVKSAELMALKIDPSQQKKAFGFIKEPEVYLSEGITDLTVILGMDNLKVIAVSKYD